MDPKAGLGRFGEEKILLLIGYGPKTFQLVASRYTTILSRLPTLPTSTNRAFEKSSTQFPLLFSEIN